MVKGMDGVVHEEFPITTSERWSEEGKSLETFSREHRQQGTQEWIFTKSYDHEEQRFALTRRAPHDPKPETYKPDAHETYDPKTRTFHGVVVEDLPPDSTWTWKMQCIGNARSIYTAEFRSNGKIQHTRTDTLQRAKATHPSTAGKHPVDPKGASPP